MGEATTEVSDGEEKACTEESGTAGCIIGAEDEGDTPSSVGRTEGLSRSSTQDECIQWEDQVRF